jgi:hypothetical protein
MMMDLSKLLLASLGLLLVYCSQQNLPDIPQNPQRDPSSVELCQKTSSGEECFSPVLLEQGYLEAADRFLDLPRVHRSSAGL